MRRIIFVLLCLISLHVAAGPYAAPGDNGLRRDLNFLRDTGIIQLPLATWPLAWGDVVHALDKVDVHGLDTEQSLAYARLERLAAIATNTETVDLKISISAASNPGIIRTFEGQPRENGEVGVRAQWTGKKFAYSFDAAQVTSPSDNEDTRFDNSYVGLVLGNWMLSAGWQQRWWGPGRDGSLILSSNARPMPSMAIQRNVSREFRTPWLKWIGPWTATAFMGLLDDGRQIDDTLLFGVRATFLPIEGLEIGLSRTAQWCGNDRPCGMGAFLDLLIGNDNRSVNVDPDDEPGNQLAGIDLRWRLPMDIPVAAYVQWIGEDTRRGGPEIGSWMRQAGVEVWGEIGRYGHTTHLEVSETSCREGGLGFSDIKPDCGYEHSIYRSGYRYRGRAIGHSIDGDGLSYSIGSTLVQSGGRMWTMTLRRMEINRAGAPSPRHSLSPTPQDLTSISVSYSRETGYGDVHLGVAYDRLDYDVSGGLTSDASVFLEWSTQ